MTQKAFYDWQTAGGGGDVMRLVAVLERLDVPWCVIGGVAVNHWAEEPIVTADVDLVIALERVEEAVRALEAEGFKAQRFPGSVSLKGNSKVSVRISTEERYRSFPARAVAADVWGVLMRVASLEDTLEGKLSACADAGRRPSKRQKDGLDILRLVESHPALADGVPEEVRVINWMRVGARKMNHVWLQSIACACAAVLLAMGVRAQEAPVAARNEAGRYQAVTGGETVYVIDTDTGAMLSKRLSGASSWEIESYGFSNTVAAVRKRQDQQQKAREALLNWMESTKETFPKLSIEEKIKAATRIFVVKYREPEKLERPNSLLRSLGSSSWIVAEYLKKDARRPLGGYEVPEVGGGFVGGFTVDPESGTKESIAVVCFEVRKDEADNMFLCIPTAPVKAASRSSGISVIEASPTIVEDIKAVLAKKE